MCRDQSINTTNRKLKRFSYIGLYHLLICLKKILRTLIKLWRKEWTSPWWATNHKPVKSFKWTKNRKNKKSNNFEQVKSFNTIWLLSQESHKSTEKTKAKVTFMMEDHNEVMPDYRRMTNKSRKIQSRWIKRKA